MSIRIKNNIKHDIKRDIIFWVDTGCSRDLLEGQLVKEGYSKEDFDLSLFEMIEAGTLTLGLESGLIVVTEWMPNTAEKLRNE